MLLILLLVSLTKIVLSQESVCDKTQSFLYKESDESQRMVEIVFKGEKISDCFLYGDKRLAEISISKKSCQPKVVYVEKNILSKKADLCSEWLITSIKRRKVPTFDDPNFPRKYSNKIDRAFYDGLMIYPGTKWCGAGSVAGNYDDLGEEKETDMCCRKHDNCFDYIVSGETKYNLTNNAVHTKSHCDCDQEFSNCLKSTKKSSAKEIGSLYFNLVKIQCFKNDYPIVKCLEYYGFFSLWSSCQKYLQDMTKATVYQFFDAKYFE